MSRCIDLCRLQFANEAVQQKFIDTFKLYTDNAFFKTKEFGYSVTDDKAFARVMADVNGVSKMNFNIK